MAGVSITAVVAAYQRPTQTVATLERIRSCRPSVAEIIVHVDRNETDCEAVIRRQFPDITILQSEHNIGPGGARNKLVAAAKNDLVASFDDDSYPMDEDYFARIRALSDKFPEAATFSAIVYERDKQVDDGARKEEWAADFAGGACVFRRADFLGTNGFVPLPLAYGMEEVDLALRLHARGLRILRSPWLRVYHDTNLERHADPEDTSASIANLALLTYLRYPPSFWFVGFIQIAKRILWLLRHGRFRGIPTGVLMIPKYLHTNRSFRELVNATTIRSYLRLRRAPIAIPNNGP